VARPKADVALKGRTADVRAHPGPANSWRRRPSASALVSSQRSSHIGFDPTPFIENICRRTNVYPLRGPVLAWLKTGPAEHRKPGGFCR